MENTTLNKKTMMALRKCGHYLHHNAGPASGLNEDILMAPLSDEEKESLCSLLEKCLQSWNHAKQENEK